MLTPATPSVAIGSTQQLPQTGAPAETHQLPSLEMDQRIQALTDEMGSCALKNGAHEAQEIDQRIAELQRENPSNPASQAKIAQMMKERNHLCSPLCQLNDNVMSLIFNRLTPAARATCAEVSQRLHYTSFHTAAENYKAHMISTVDYLKRALEILPHTNRTQAVAVRNFLFGLTARETANLSAIQERAKVNLSEASEMLRVAMDRIEALIVNALQTLDIQELERLRDFCLFKERLQAQEGSDKPTSLLLCAAVALINRRVLELQARHRRYDRAIDKDLNLFARSLFKSRNSPRTLEWLLSLPCEGIFYETAGDVETMSSLQSSSRSTHFAVALQMVQAGRIDEALTYLQRTKHTRVCRIFKDHYSEDLTQYDVDSIIDEMMLKGRGDGVRTLLNSCLLPEDRTALETRPEIRMIQEGRMDEAKADFVERLGDVTVRALTAEDRQAVELSRLLEQHTFEDRLSWARATIPSSEKPAKLETLALYAVKMRNFDQANRSAQLMFQKDRQLRLREFFAVEIKEIAYQRIQQGDFAGARRIVQDVAIELLKDRISDSVERHIKEEERHTLAEHPVTKV